MGKPSLPGVALALATGLGLSGCGLRTPPPQVPVARPVPVSVPGPARPPVVTTTDPVTTVSAPTAPAVPLTTTAGGSSGAEAAYERFLTALSALDGGERGNWLAALETVATPQLVASVKEEVATIQAAHEHTVGRLADAGLEVSIGRAAARLSDCLDEYDWYVVEDSSGVPDPGVSRGHYRGSATAVETAGRWYVSQFTPGTAAC